MYKNEMKSHTNIIVKRYYSQSIFKKRTEFAYKILNRMERGIGMQFLNDKKVWLFFALLIMVITTLCFWSMNRQEKKVYANGRIVEQATPKERVIMIEWGRG